MGHFGAQRLDFEWSRKWIGIPFKWGGSSFRGCDCAGLVRLFLKEEFRVRLPFDFAIHSISYWYKHGEKHILRFLNRHAIKVLTPQYGDIVVIHSWYGSSHVGIMVDYDRFLHVNQDRTSCLGRVSLAGHHRILGYWRVKQLWHK